jgi:hypothetical protein
VLLVKTVRVEVKGVPDVGVPEAGLKLSVRPEGALTDSCTDDAEPLTKLTLTVKIADCPWVTVCVESDVTVT